MEDKESVPQTGLRTLKIPEKMNIFKQFFDVYCREFRLILRDGGVILFLLFLPLAYPVIYSLIYNPEIVREVKLVVVDHDRTSRSRELVRKLDATQGVRNIGYAANLSEAKRALHGHACFGILEIPEGFEKKTGRQEQANAVVYSDMSLLLRYRAFLVSATEVSQAMGQEIMIADIDRTVPIGTTLAPEADPMPISNIALGNLESGFDSFVMPGVVILILQQCLVLACGMMGGAKHESERLIGYNPTNHVKSVFLTMTAQGLALFTLIILPAIFLIHYIPLIFAFPMEGNTLEIMIFILPMIMSSIALGFCFQGFVTQRENVFVLWVVTSLMFLFLSGITWPRYAITGFWRVLSDLVPATWAVQGFVKMNSNGSSLAQVADCWLWQWGLVVLYTVLAWIVQKYMVRPRLYRQGNAIGNTNRPEII